MTTFPLLSSGAITQYPAQSLIGHSVNVIRFLDGSDQRFLNIGKQYRRWRIQLDLLSDEEIASLEAFFSSQKGMYSPFSFSDPFSRSQILNCRLGAPDLVTEHSGVNISSTSVWIIETNG